jgi:hypothetical protein
MIDHILKRALPEHVSRHWGVIGTGIKEAAPEYFLDDKDSLNNILQSLLEGRMQCWVAMSRNGKDEFDPYGIAVTHITHDVFSGVKNLLIICMYSFRKQTADPMMYIKGLDVLKKFARGNGCKSIIAYTRIEKLARFVENRLGGDAGQRLISIPLEE